MAYLERVASVVNHELPDFAQGVYRPHEMMLKRASNCLGRMILSYTLLRASGTPDQEMQLAVDDTHGTPHGVDKFWRGHALLIVHDTDAPGVLDSNDSVYVRDLDIVQPDPDRPSVVDGRRIDSKPYTVFPVSEGLVAYQQNHPKLEDPVVTIQEFADMYGGLAQLVAPSLRK